MCKFLAVLLAVLLTVEGYAASVHISPNKTFASQVKASNTYYEIQDDFDLRGSTVKIPTGCTLSFHGGSIKNGTLDLNGCRIEGEGIKCKILNPTDYAYPLSRYLADTKDEELTTSVVQTLMDAAVPVIIDYGELVFNRPLSVYSNVTVQSASDKRVVLSFPFSAGFVWDKKVYSQNNTFRGLIVKAKYNCFDFVNGGATERPFNVYFNIFSNIRVLSEDGDCFTAGEGNYGALGDACTFDNLFENIEVGAPKGYGFVGISGNTHHFTKVRCIGCGKAFFFNCAGVFDSCNGTWGKTPTFYKGTRRAKDVSERYTCLFRNCNVEEYKSVLFDCNDTRCYMELTFENCSFYITPNEKKIIDYYPFNFAVLTQLRMRNNFFFTYDKGKYDSKHCLFGIGYVSNLERIDVDRELDIMDRHSQVYTVSQTKIELKKK